MPASIWPNIRSPSSSKLPTHSDSTDLRMPKRNAIVIVDSTAVARKSAALKDFALSQTGIRQEDVGGFRADIEMQFDPDN